jgi:PncC family amidohydrolase
MKKLAKKLGRLLLKHKKALSTAESCTGGMIAKVITDIPGSSRYFMGGVVSYSNEVKIKVLHVSKKLIEKHGAVSKEVAEAMVRGVQRLMHTDCAIAVTGIAGPDGGTAKKPVGLVYISVACGKGIEVKRFIFQKDRDGNRKETTSTAIEMLIQKLQ